MVNFTDTSQYIKPLYILQQVPNLLLFLSFQTYQERLGPHKALATELLKKIAIGYTGHPTLHTHLHPPPLVLGMAFLSRLALQAGVS